ncbi:M28 family metallopeptidase [uncultured Clostridium sp.]|uniref:M28 family metallopeptidase n=1 Tax=uncultured Clostridium sp. TaxID=59620 RepID=UPI0025FD7E10|nr:M28 family peptidase [uncultured Clostridium sp.]MDU4884009.1 M28 family peptidase [Clostridium celatum]MDU7077252.1 M28 family peptidase [Clostridium celatum]
MNIKNKLISIISSILVLNLLFTGCSSTLDKDVSSKNIVTYEESLNIEAGKNPEKLDIESIMGELTSDEYLSRVVGTDENTKSEEFIKNYFEAVGLDPFNNGSFYHEVYLNKEMRAIFNPNEENNNKINNIIGVIKGKDSSKAVVISAHLDHVTVRERVEETSNSEDSKIKVTKIEGAIDNASGIAVLLESAKDLTKYYKDEKPEHDIIFAAFNAEELGLIGSSKFVEEFKGNYEDWYNINIDCVGMKGNEGLAVKNTSPLCEELYDDFIEVLDEDKIYYEMVPYARNEDGRIVGSSDHMSFRRGNDASLVIGQDGIVGIVHSEADNISIVDFELIESIKDALVDFIVKSDNKIY